MTEAAESVPVKSVSGSRDATSSDGAAAQLRLALVCYGGVSLAIYMHGVTKELHKLVAASCEFDAVGGDGDNPFDPATDSRHAYFEELRSLSQAGAPLSVAVDVIAGTSAGGINGVCLAKTLARNGSQDALKRLWVDEGDLKRLLRYGRFGGWRWRAAITVLRTMLRANKPVSPLRGERMSRLLYDAIADMDSQVDERRSLVQPDTPLQLFVTTTDLDGFPVLVGTGAGGVAQMATNNAQVLRFDSVHEDDFGPDAVGALAFAARATSSFPGAFPPVSLDSFAAELDGRRYDRESVARHFLNRYRIGGRTSDDAWFVDGGVLDNAPFDLVVNAIAGKRAASEVIRKVVYIQPDPGGPLAVNEDNAPAAHGPQGYVGSLLKAVIGVRGSHSILNELERLRELNVRILEIGAITEAQMAQINERIADAWKQSPGTRRNGAGGVGASDEDAWDSQDETSIKELADKLYRSMPAFIGAGYPTYCRLKVQHAGRMLAEAVSEEFEYPPDSSRSSFVLVAIQQWAHRQVEWADPDPTRLVQLLGPVDVPYRQRRLMFILAGINRLYGHLADGSGVARADLDSLKATAWRLMTELHAVPKAAVRAMREQGRLAFLTDKVGDASVFDDPNAFAQKHNADFLATLDDYRSKLDARLTDHSIAMWRAFGDHTSGSNGEQRRSLLSRYLGFPLWDCLIFPTVALGQLPQFTPIGVSQFSPITACALATPHGGKLKGVALHHFGGFTDPAWRENDYLWGRLDAAELILRTLRTAHSPGPAPGAGPNDAIREAGPRLHDAVASVLASESDLRRIPARDLQFISDSIQNTRHVSPEA